MTGVLLLAAALAAAPDDDALLEELEEQARHIDVIQNRKYELLHEVSILLGGLPSDPYYYGLTATGGYTLHLGQSIAWEVAQFTYSYNRDKKLKEEVERVALATGTRAPDLPAIDWILATHLVLKPLYGKEAIFNTEVLHLEAFAQAGPAMVHSTDPVRPFSFGIDLGAGLRFWLSDAVSLRLDIGELLYWVQEAGGKDSDMKGALRLMFGLGFNLRGEE
jgi:outer membrane beta-barrel protein